MFNLRGSIADLIIRMRFRCLRIDPQLSLALTALCCCAVGCSSSSPGKAPGLVIFVPGVAGDGSWYRNFTPALRATGDQRTVKSFGWGAPSFAFFMNFNNVSIHEAAERKLADLVVDYRKSHPQVPIDIVAHSAGGGVTLGALSKLPAGIHVRKVILLHPSISPTYALSKPLEASESIDLFYSDRDKTFLDWRTSTFGTYDNVKTKAAGNAGFDMSALDPSLRSKVRMHAYSDGEKALGNDGDHFGALSEPFLRERVLPLLWN